MDPLIFKQIKMEILEFILKAIDAPDAFHKTKIEATEAAIGALGKFVLYQSEINDQNSEDLLLKFLDLLPLKDDADETQATHRMLLEEILAKNIYLTSGSQKVQDTLVRVVKIIRNVDESNPDLEILDDYSRDLIKKIIS